MAVDVKHITKKYGQQVALDDVSFQVQTGEVVGFIGPNGAGKSTMMKIMTGYLPANTGKVAVNGIDVFSNPIGVQKILGYLPEHNPLYLEQYVTEYLHFVAQIYKIGKPLSSQIKSIIRNTGLQSEKHKKIGALSKGYRQRVGLAQALLHNPELLILDEPTSGLDPNQIVEIRNLIRQAGQDKTVFLSTHIMQEVEAICDRIIIINKGKIVANDTTENIKKQLKESNRTVLVEFDLPVQEDVLTQLPNVTQVIHLQMNSWLIKSHEENDLRSDIFTFAVDNGLKVLTLQEKENTLEHVFQQLTK